MGRRKLSVTHVKERGSSRRGRKVSSRNGKGCDIGYALAAASCEGANSMDARTVTALDVTAAFAIPDPGGFLAKPSVFSGRDARRIASPCGSLSLLRISYGLI